MRFKIIWGLFILGLGGLAAQGQTPELSFVLPGGSAIIRGGQQITVEVFVEGVLFPQLIQAYQVQLVVVPVAGATGTLSLAGPVQDNSLFIDTDRLDWIFAGATSFFTPVNAETLRTAGTLLSGGFPAPTPKYCSTYIFEAPIDAVGDFQINFVALVPDSTVPATFLINASFVPIPVTLAPDGALTVTVLPPSLEPPNNDCVDALAASDGTTPFTTVDATTGGIDLDAACDEGGGVAIDQDVWYEHVASCTGVLTVSTCDDADFDTRLAVYGDGLSTCACPTDNTNLLACNDSGAGCASGTSEVSLDVTAGSCLTIRVGGLGVAEGSGNLTISCTPDVCDNALAVLPGSGVSGSTANTVVNDAPGLDCGTGLVDSPGVWYSVTGTGNLMTASLCGAGSYDSRLSVFGGTCLGLICVADANDTCGNQESVTWCSGLGVEYLILVHGVGGASGDFSLNISDQSCSDGNACTDDACTGAACTHQDNFDGSVDCCVPSTGDVTTIDDANPCTNDSCNASTGFVTHAPIPDGPNSGCDDQSPCTVDQCVAGACVNDDINDQSCQNDTDCPGDATCGGDGFCVCIGATLELVAEPGSLSVAGCYTAGGQFIVTVELGPPGGGFIVPAGRAIVGAQFFISYDSTTLSLTRVDPGAVLGTGSPFTTELQEVIDPTAGTLDYLVGVNFGGAGTRVPGTVAVLTFQAVAECDATIVYRASGPGGIPNLLTTMGGALEPGLLDLGLLQIEANAPTLSGCQSEIQVLLDPGQLSSVVSWPTPLATDTCDTDPIQVVCDPPSGTAFGAGRNAVVCTAADSCDLQDSCSFDVVVQASTMTVDIELSPTMSPSPFDRCITFDLWDCDGPAGAQHATVTQTISFANGVASGVQVPIPGGAWECAMARDELHTLRSTDLGLNTVDGFSFDASFVGARSTGGHWLVGGNLNDDNFIDIRDFGIFFPFFLTIATPGTPCGVSGPHANFNGDSVVDLLDLIFVSGNSLQASDAPCCGAGGAGRAAGVGDGPIMSISVAELRRTRQYGLIKSDVNHDGVLDINDMIAVITGNIPEPQKPIRSGVRGSAPVKSGRTRTEQPRPR